MPLEQDAIASALTVGFVPYRFRVEHNHRLPEVLPMGTYTWSVVRGDQVRRCSAYADSVCR